jgi:hypothetical protein
LRLASRVLAILPSAWTQSNWNDGGLTAWTQANRYGYGAALICIGVGVVSRLRAGRMGRVPAWAWRSFARARLSCMQPVSVFFLFSFCKYVYILAHLPELQSYATDKNSEEHLPKIAESNFTFFANVLTPLNVHHYMHVC